VGNTSRTGEASFMKKLGHKAEAQGSVEETLGSGT